MSAPLPRSGEWCDPFVAGWSAALEQEAQRAQASGRSLYLLLDGAMKPSLHAALQACGVPIAALFGLRGQQTAEALDASPLLVNPHGRCTELQALLSGVDGFPMLTAIETKESLDALSERLAHWCVVAVDDMRFHFRFADTRRLPAIAQSLTPVQQRHMLGPTHAWRCIGRDGQWQNLPVPPPAAARGAHPSDMPPAPTLDDAQFAALVRDSEADEWLAHLQGQEPEAVPSGLPPSQRHLRASVALLRADAEGLSDASERLDAVRAALTSDADDRPAADTGKGRTPDVLGLVA